MLFYDFVTTRTTIGRRIYATLVATAAVAGAGIAAYHLWVQHVGPDPTAGCAPGWNYWVENYSYRFAWSKTLQNAFTGHADCADINWSFLGLSMPGWTLVCYVLLGTGALWAGFRRR
jgi:disulfide bond formation protein DsbB